MPGRECICVYYGVCACVRACVCVCVRARVLALVDIRSERGEWVRGRADRQNYRDKDSISFIRFKAQGNLYSSQGCHKLLFKSWFEIIVFSDEPVTSARNRHLVVA